MTHKLSDWQSGKTIPAHEGVYKRKNPYHVFYSLFKAGKWMVGWADHREAENETFVSLAQGLEWRGIL